MTTQDQRWRRVLDSQPTTTRKVEVWRPKTRNDFAHFDGYQWTDHKTGEPVSEPTHWRPAGEP